MINLRNLSRVFRTKDVETTALNEVNLSINEGEFVAIRGPSGCGKSTLLSILALLDRPTAGQYIFLGQNVSGWSERHLADLRKKTIGIIYQSFNLIEDLTVFENVELPLRYHNIPRHSRRERTEDALRRLKIDHRSSHLPQQLSGGQQQRVAVARAMVIAPKLILADEPTGNLDSTNGTEVMNMLTDLNRNGATVIMVTHSEHDSGYAKRIVWLFDGKIIADVVEPAKRGTEHV